MEFQQRAHQSAVSTALLSPPEALAQSLTNDRPTVESAIKSYMSLCAARSLSASDTDVVIAPAPCEDTNIQCLFLNSENSQKASLFCARALLKKINMFKIESTKELMKFNENMELEQSELELEVIRVVWNGFVKSGKKPCKFLGLSTLCHVYPLILDSIRTNTESSSLVSQGLDIDEENCFYQEFGLLLKRAKRRKYVNLDQMKNNDGTNHEYDDDSCLLWDLDGGQVELGRRRARRKMNASGVSKRMNCNQNITSTTKVLMIDSTDEAPNTK
mmetsp:Transcript_38515/g.44886  ORF Transcript_38515/g.44886 Transcript_38515/m.44886 type:complete len:273 (-) Transcript_38515:575-1393(-)|eukprot:CAMPEP_0194390356 /NCGR_PEP_ID=MMETSP0174-20130528/109622_1 /TAXON_ID=216777 /ORGANISM="Proboscia alata, Strain PI-D3" /LENGTH=272 /DNA_ID=CAMNT_0039183633 /DNA_START=55 /DNA_END=873 /DNA_ORIENTATION=-